MTLPTTSQKKKLKCAVVGVGYLGRFHAQKYAKLETVELVGVCDANFEQAQKVAEELKTKAFENYEDLSEKIEAVAIASSTQTHYKIAKYFLEKGIHVFVEKPMTVTCEEAEELCTIAEKKNLKLQVGHVERFNPALRAAQEKLKKVLFIECHRLAPFKPRGVDVGVVLDLMIHDIDVVMSLVNSPIKSVSAVGVPVLTKNEDIANARIEFENGAIANITSSRVSQTATRKFRVFQPEQYLSIDFGTGQVNLTTRTGEWKEGEIPLTFDEWSLEKEDALYLEAQSFVDAIQNNKPCVVPGQDGLRAMRVAEMVLDDLKKRKVQ